MLAVDVLRVVSEHGAVGLVEPESAFPDPDASRGFWVALDAAVDHGFLRCTGNKHGLAGGYRLTQRGRRALQASASGTAAA